MGILKEGSYRPDALPVNNQQHQNTTRMNSLHQSRHQIIKTSPLKEIWEERIALAQLHNRVQWDAQIHPQNCPSLRRSPPHLIHPSLDRVHSPSQMAPGSNQPFCHITPSGQTNRQTDKTGDRSIR